MAYPKALKIPTAHCWIQETKQLKQLKLTFVQITALYFIFNTFTFEKLVKLTDEHTSSYSHLRDSGAADAKLSTQRLPDGTKPEPRSSYGVSNRCFSETFKIQNQNKHTEEIKYYDGGKNHELIE